MKTFKLINSTAAIAALSSILVTSNATAQVPLDSNGNFNWGMEGINISYIMPGVSLYTGINNGGINNGTFPSIGFNGVVVENTNIGISDIAWAALDPSGGSYMSGARLETRGGYMYTGGTKELQLGWSGNYVGGFGYQPNMFLGDNYSACTTGFSIGQGMSPSTPPAHGLYVAGAFKADGGAIYSSGSGNLSAQSFITLSDRNLKENIQPIPEGKSLEMARALNDYSWKFKTQSDSAEKAPAANGGQLGPMAQDWHAVTGLDDGRHISLTAMQGLLLGAVQDLASQLPAPGTVAKSCDSTSGHGAGLVKWDADYIYISVGTNQWKRAALTTW